MVTKDPLVIAASRHGADADAELARIASRVVTHFEAAPCAVVAAAVRRHGAWARGIGAAGTLVPNGTEASEGTVFDLASVTKSVVALACARLAKRGVLPFRTPLGDVVEEARGTVSEKVPIELFLAHRAGLDGHRPLYAPLVDGSPVDRRAALRVAASARREGCEGAPPPEGFPPLYSDLGYLLVGEAIARATNAPLDEVIVREVADPTSSGILSARMLDAAGLVARVAPTEVVDWRGGAIVGRVHDENAWAIGRDGTCGHAGLFGTADDVLAIGEAIVEVLAGDRDDWLSAADLEPLVRERSGGTLRAGFDGKSLVGSSSGDRFGPRTFGHLGFTGTSLWIDPDADLVGVLLTNRVHPTRAKDAIKRARPATYDAIFAWSESRLGRHSAPGTGMFTTSRQSASVNSSVDAVPPRSFVRTTRDA